MAAQRFVDAFMVSSLVRSSGSRLRGRATAAFGCGGPCLYERLFAAIAVYDLLDDLDAEPRPGRRVHPAIDMRERAGDEIMLHGISERLELEELAGRRIERDGEACGRHDSRRPRVGVGLPAVELAAFGDLLETRDAFGSARIDADHVDGSSRQHPLELLERPLALAISDAGRRLGSKIGVAFRIPR